MASYYCCYVPTDVCTVAKCPKWHTWFDWSLSGRGTHLSRLCALPGALVLRAIDIHDGFFLSGCGRAHRQSTVRLVNSCLLLKINFIVSVNLGDSLTHWGRDEMNDISQTTFSNVFSSMKMFEFRLKFHWSLFPPRVKSTIFQHWFR